MTHPAKPFREYRISDREINISTGELESRISVKGFCEAHFMDAGDFLICSFRSLEKEVHVACVCHTPVTALLFCRRGEVLYGKKELPGQHHFFLQVESGEPLRFIIKEEEGCFTALFFGREHLRSLMEVQLCENPGEKKHGKIKESRPDAFSQCHTPEIGFLMHELFSLNCPEYLRPLLVRARALEILALQIQALDLPGQGREGETAFRAVVQARQILDRAFIHSPTIPQLAKEAGINENDLKRRFKEAYGVTVFGYVLEKRMAMAKSLLKTGNTVSETAFAVGYKNPQHFTKAFKRRFGVLPSTFKSRD